MTEAKEIPELCVPAGNLKILKFALAYGADAVYIGGEKFNLRSSGNNFSTGDLKQAVKIAHDRKKKVYFTLNSIISESELKSLEDYLDEIKDTGFDAVIISDPGLVSLVKKFIPETRIHISTQVSTSNHLAADFWAGTGACRVNLARELCIDDIRKISKNSKIETEVFVHGALCISYSGRCHLSKYLAGRDANKGLCAHTCRWKYYLVEEKRPNMFFPVFQDNRGSYILNSRDLCLVEKLDLIAGAGVSAVKIEGRMKTESYVSTVTWVYRSALDLLKADNFSSHKKEFLSKQLDKTSHRTFTEGFMFYANMDDKSIMDNDSAGYIQKYKFAGDIKGYDGSFDGPVITAGNQIKAGSTADIIQPFKNPFEYQINKIIDLKSGAETTAANTNDIVVLPGMGKLDEFAIIKIRL
jgi:putative protease